MQFHVSWPTVPGYTYRLVMTNSWLGATFEHPAILYEGPGGSYTDIFSDLFGLDGSSFFVVRLSKPGDPIPAEYDYNWTWEDIPGYPVGRVWDGVTIEPGFPNWNWANWPNNWCISYEVDEEIASTAVTRSPEFSFLPSAPDIERFKVADSARRVQQLQKIQRLKILSRAQVIAALTGVLADIWLENEMARLRELDPWSYVVYEKQQRGTGKVYSGRTCGVGTPEQVLTRRDAQHWILNNFENYEQATWNAAITTAQGQSLFAAAAMWGREQQSMDYHGGAISDRGGNPANPGYGSRNRATNKVRAIAKDERVGYVFWLTARVAWREIWEFTGDKDKRFGIPILPDKPMVKFERDPYFFPN